MDKFEYNLKIDKLKRLVEKRDFNTAALLADTIDWRHVKNSRLLSVVSMVYEKNRRYKDAKDILMICYERTAGGRRLIYKLTELSAKEGNFEDAELFYKEYEEIAPGDPGLLILRYEILAEQGAPVGERIRVLEKYQEQEFDERWAYELARLYQKAGRQEDCVRLCDDIILWFSVGTYVEKAAALKACYEPLTPDQEEKVQNQEKYKAYVRQVAEECEIQAEKKIEEAREAAAGEAVPDRKEDAADAVHENQLDEDIILLDEEDREAAGMAEADGCNAADAAEPDSGDPGSAAETDGGAADTAETDGSTAAGAGRLKKKIMRLEDIGKGNEGQTKKSVEPENEPMEGADGEAEEADSWKTGTAAAWVKEAVKEAGTADRQPEETGMKAETAAVQAGAGKEEENIAGDAQTAEEERQQKYWEKMEENMSNQWESEVEKVISNFNRENEESAENQENKEESTVIPGLLYVSAPKREEGMEYATEAIRELHKIKGEKGNKVARITGSKLNLLGLEASLEKLNGADLVIVEAASLSDATLAEILRETQKKPMQAIIVFVDTAEQIERLDQRAGAIMVDVLYQIEQEERAKKEARKIQIRPVKMPEKSLVEAKFAMAEQMAAAKAPEKEPEREPEMDLLDLDSQIPDPVVRPVQPVIQPSVHRRPEDQPGTWETPAASFSNIDTEKLKENLVSVAETMMYQREEPAPQKESGRESRPTRRGEQQKTGELSAPAFVAKIKEYAEELDCVIEDIAGLAIYALADKYTEDGVPLTEELAKQVTENAVVRADKKGLGSLFKSKYDKEGRLILKESHFKM